MRSSADVGCSGLAHSRRASSSQRCQMGFEVRANTLMDLALCTQTPHQIVVTGLEVHHFLKYHLKGN